MAILNFDIVIGTRVTKVCFFIAKISHLRFLKSGATTGYLDVNLFRHFYLELVTVVNGSYKLTELDMFMSQEYLHT